KDRGVGAAAQREHQYDHCSESRFSGKYASGITKVLPEFLDYPHAPSVPALLLDLLDAAEPQQRCAPGLLRLHATGNVSLDVLLEVVAEFLVKLKLDSALPKERPHPHNEPIKHHPPPSVRPCPGSPARIPQLATSTTPYAELLQARWRSDPISPARPPTACVHLPSAYKTSLGDCSPMRPTPR